MARPAIPVSVVTGFLGAGKTTLINRLLKDPALTDTAVIVNEFGDVGIDHLLVESAQDGIIELSDGCLCCSVRGEFVDTLLGLLDRLETGRIGRLARVVVETTGLADPGPLLQAIMGHPELAEAYRIDGVITVVDAVNGTATLDAHEEAVAQVALADRIVLSKSGLAEDAETTMTLRRRLQSINPVAPVLDSDGVTVETLFGSGPQDLRAKMPGLLEAQVPHSGHAHGGSHDHDHGHGRHRHDTAIATFSLVHDAPVEEATIAMFLDLLRGQLGEKLLRMKGIVWTVEDGDRPLVIHGVQRLLHRPERLGAWPSDERGTRIVIIARDIPESYVRGLFDAFLGKPQVDTPDRTALVDNPLAIPGQGRF